MIYRIKKYFLEYNIKALVNKPAAEFTVQDAQALANMVPYRKVLEKEKRK